MERPIFCDKCNKLMKVYCQILDDRLVSGNFHAIFKCVCGLAKTILVRKDGSFDQVENIYEEELMEALKI